MAKGKTVSLVLGSGAARGLAHIGVIEWLDEHGYKIESISGASMGALVGGIYAAGKLDVYKKWACALEKADVVRFLRGSLRGGPGARVVSGGRVMCACGGQPRCRRNLPAHRFRHRFVTRRQRGR